MIPRDRAGAVTLHDRSLVAILDRVSRQIVEHGAQRGISTAIRKRGSEHQAVIVFAPDTSLKGRRWKMTIKVYDTVKVRADHPIVEIAGRKGTVIRISDAETRIRVSFPPHGRIKARVVDLRASDLRRPR